MGNSISNVFINHSKLDKILQLEGWIEIIDENDTKAYHNKFRNVKISDYPISVSDYNDIYDFYKTELLEPQESIDLLYNMVNNSAIILLDEDFDRIYNIIRRIEAENDLNNIKLIGLCCS